MDVFLNCSPTVFRRPFPQKQAHKSAIASALKAMNPSPSRKMWLMMTGGGGEGGEAKAAAAAAQH